MEGIFSSTKDQTKEFENIYQKDAGSLVDDVVNYRIPENNGNTADLLANMYAEHGFLERAQSLFDGMPSWALSSWNSLIVQFAKGGEGLEALVCFQQMQEEGISPDAVTLVCVLKACGNTRAVNKGQEIYAKIVKEGLLENNRIVGNALVDMYGKCGLLEKAREVFEDLPVQDVFSWTTLIAGYAQCGYGQEALNCYEEMQLKGISPNSVTFSCVLKACGIVKAAEKGHEIHANIIKDGLLTKDIVLGNALVDMYAKCGNLSKAQEVFDILPKRDVVSWNALIAGYAQYGHCNEVFQCFDQMRREGLSPSAVTLSCVLKACGSIQSAEKGESIHAYIKDDLLCNDVLVGTALVDMYSKCGMLSKAEGAFHDLRIPSRASWNALIAGYAQHGEGEDALHCFEKMQHAGFVPDKVTFLCTLQACGHTGAPGKGQEIHARMITEGFMGEDIAVGTTLVDMYANCGMMLEAQAVFSKLLLHDLISWTALLDGYAQLGEEEIVFKSINKMIREGKQPDSTILTILLNACSHSGLLDKGENCFEIISTCYGISPTSKHHTCMVDLYGRAGHLDKAIAFIDQIIPSPDSRMAWHSVLGACKKWENVNLGKLAFKHAIELDEKDVIAYVSMRNIYAAAGMKEDVEKIEGVGMKMESWMPIE